MEGNDHQQCARYCQLLVFGIRDRKTLVNYTSQLSMPAPSIGHRPKDDTAFYKLPERMVLVIDRRVGNSDEYPQRDTLCLIVRFRSVVGVSKNL